MFILTIPRVLSHPIVHTFIYIHTVEPLNNGHVGDECFVHCSDGGRNVWTIYRQGVKSLSIVGRLSTLQSVHYQRFYILYVVCQLSVFRLLP